MLPEITNEQMVAYQAAARRRQQQKARRLELRREQGWRVARQAKQLLQHYGVERVVVFGSLLHPQRIHERSDVDLAVWGLDERVYYRAVAQLLSLDPAIPVDLVQAELAPSSLLAAIEKGVPL